MTRNIQALLWLLLMLGVAVVIATFALALRPAHAHVHDRPDLAPWFNKLQNRQGGICCINNMQEAVIIDDYSANEDGSYEINLNGRKVHVKEGQVVIDPNKYGTALAWPKVGGTEVWCFLPGAGI